MCCQPGLLAVTVFDGSPNSTARIRGKLWMKRPGRWQRKKDGKPGHRISCRRSNMIDSIIRSGGFKGKKYGLFTE